MHNFAPADWYWIDGAGRIYGSMRQSLVAPDDPDLSAWSETHGMPRAWPRDEDGEQTDAALRDLLEGYGLEMWPPDPIAVLLAYAAARRWELETSGLMVDGALIRTDEGSQARITGAIALLNAVPDLTSIDWQAQPGSWLSLDRDAMMGIGQAVGLHVQRCFSALRQIQDQIAATPPSITSVEQVDAAFAAALAGG